MPTSKQKLKEILQSLEAYELPEQIQNAIPDIHDSSSSSSSSSSSNDAAIDPALIQRYKEARDLYLRRHKERLFLEYVASYNGESFEFPEAPSEEEQAAQQERLDQLRDQVAEDVSTSHQHILELQHKYKTFCSRREELRNIVQDMEDSNNNDQTMDETELDEDDDMDDEELAAEEERLAALQEKKAQLQMKLYNIRQRNAQLKADTEQKNKEIEEMSGGSGKPAAASPTSIQVEASESKKQLEELQKMKNLYDDLREVMEALSSIKVLSVGHTTDKSATSGSEAESKTGDRGAALPELQMHVQLMDEHEISILLRADPSKPDQYRVISAKFLTPTVVRAPSDEGSDNSEGRQTIEMTIPPLDDLVKVCACYPPVEELRFLMRETMARIRMVKSRVVELNLLDRHVLTTIGAYHKKTEESFGGEEQEVVCSLKECLTVVLRLTADFPLLPGSVRIWQMVGVAGWNDEDVDKIKERVSQQNFCSATELIEAVQAEIARMQEKENLTLPKTPMLPLRRKKD